MVVLPDADLVHAFLPYSETDTDDVLGPIFTPDQDISFTDLPFHDLKLDLDPANDPIFALYLDQDFVLEAELRGDLDI
jgi:hypothetical protein